MKQEKEYFAFISYKSEDVEWATWLQHELEHYHLPASFNGRTDVPQELRPVFRDIDELSAGNLPGQIRKALVNSQNLIVICSPQSAKSPWVNQEVETFISLGRTDRVFPFIVEGNAPSEFFPPALRDLPKDEERLGGDVSKKGRDAAFVKVVAGMLGVGFDSLWNRYEKEKAEEERKQREQRDNLLRVQSRLLAEKSIKFNEDGDSVLAKLLALEALPKNVIYPERPIVKEAAEALRNALLSRDTIIKESHCPVNFAGFCYNDLYLLSYSSDKNVMIWDLIANRLVFKKQVPSKVIYSDITPDNESLIIGFTEGIQVWNIREDVMTHQILHHSILNCFSLSDGHSVFYSVGKKKYVFDIITGNDDICGFSFKPSVLRPHYSPDEKYYLSYGTEDNKKITIYNTENHEIVHILEGSPHKIAHAVFSPDGTNVACVTKNNILIIWDVVSEELKFIAENQFEYEEYSEQDNDHDISSLSDGAVQVELTQEKAKPVKKKKQQVKNGPLMITYSPDGTSVLTAHSNGKIYLNDTSNGHLLKIFEGHTAPVNSALFSKDGCLIVSSSDDNTIRIWDYKRGHILPFTKTINGIRYASYSFEGKNIVATKKNGNVILLDETYNPSATIYKDEPGAKMSVVSKSGQYIAFLLVDNTIKIWNRVNKKMTTIPFYDGTKLLDRPSDLHMIGKLDGFNEDDLELELEFKPKKASKQILNSWIDISPDEKELLSVSHTTVDIYDIDNGQKIGTLSGHKRNINTARFSYDGQSIITSSLDKTARIWNTETRETVNILQGHLGGLNYAEFSPDGHLAVTTSVDKTIRVWSVITGNEIRKFKGHQCNMASFNSIGNQIVSVSDSAEKMTIWDVETGMRLLEIDSPIAEFAYFSPTGDRIMTAIKSNLYIWQFDNPYFLPLQQAIDLARDQMKERQLTPEERKKYYIE